MAKLAQVMAQEGPPRKKGAKKLRDIRISKGAEGKGYIAEHSYDSDNGFGWHEPDKFPLSDDKALMDHIKKHMC